MGVAARWMFLGSGFVLAYVGCRADPPAGAAVIALPDGRPGIGFDDLKFSTTYGVLAPGGRSGNLDLVDPSTRAVTAIGGFSMEPLHFAGHDQGATAVDESGGFLFVTDRTTSKLNVVDPAMRRIVGCRCWAQRRRSAARTALQPTTVATPTFAIPITATSSSSLTASRGAAHEGARPRIGGRAVWVGRR